MCALQYVTLLGNKNGEISMGYRSYFNPGVSDIYER